MVGRIKDRAKFDALNAKTDENGTRRTASGFELPDRKSIGEAFTDSPEYKALVEQAPNGTFGQKQRVQSGMAGFKSLVTGASDTSAGSSWAGEQAQLSASSTSAFAPCRKQCRPAERPASV